MIPVMNYDEEDLAPGGKSIAQFPTYEDFLSSHVMQRDKDYLEDINMARSLVQIGHRGAKEGYSYDQYLAARAVIEERRAIFNVRAVLSAGMTFEEPMLRALQMREEGNRIGKNASIIYIRDKNSLGQEISGYVDYSYRLTIQDFRPIFSGNKKLVPCSRDLSFFNWNTLNVGSRNSPNYEVIATDPRGMMFRNIRDGKFINPDPFLGQYGENTSRTVVPTTIYLSVVIYDHYNRRRT